MLFKKFKKNLKKFKFKAVTEIAVNFKICKHTKSHCFQWLQPDLHNKLLVYKFFNLIYTDEVNLVMLEVGICLTLKNLLKSV